MLCYDVFMQAFRNGGPGEGNREGAMRVLRALGSGAKAHDSGFDISLPDGGGAEVYCGKLMREEQFSGCMISIRGGFSPDLARFIYTFGHEANLVLLVPGEQPVFVCTRAEQMAEVMQLLETMCTG